MSMSGLHKNFFRCAVLACAVLSSMFAAWGVNPYPQLKEKAERAFDHAEWASASALYDLMLEEKPAVPDTYGQAIVANAMRGDRAAEMRLMQKALDNHIPFDSVFSRVSQWSFHLGKTHLYEEFLKETRQEHPWMKRAIDVYLLRYYTFRRNGELMVEYSNMMLSGASDNAALLNNLAEGYMLMGDEKRGIETYMRVLDVDPWNLHALLSLGNLHAMKKDMYSAVKAVEYLEKAYSIHPTPYVAATLERLRGKKK